MLGLFFKMKCDYNHYQVSSCELLLQSLWLGMILAISGMEGFMKFQTKCIPKPFLFDIGRIIFSTMNAIEGGLGLSLVLIMSGSPFSLLLLVMTNVQRFFLTPKLIQRTRKMLLEYVEEHGTWNGYPCEKEMENMKQQMKGMGTPVPVVHGLYLSIEVGKIGTLIYLILSHL